MRLLHAMTFVLCAAVGACATPASKPVDEKALLKQGWSNVRDGESEKATAVFTRVIALYPKSSEAYLGRGIVADLAGDDGSALGDFDRAKQLEPYGSFDAVVWFMLAARRSHQNFGGGLAVEAQEYAAWPGPVLHFLERFISESALLDAAETDSSNVPIEQRRCQAFFYVGEVDRIDGRLDRAQFHLAKARETCAVSLPESAAAWADLKRLKGSE